MEIFLYKIKLKYSPEKLEKKQTREKLQQLQ